jgi:hypothetical protein
MDKGNVTIFPQVVGESYNAILLFQEHRPGTRVNFLFGQKRDKCDGIRSNFFVFFIFLGQNEEMTTIDK